MRIFFKPFSIFLLLCFVVQQATFGVTVRHNKNIASKYIHYRSDSQSTTLDRPFLYKFSWRSTIREGNAKGKFNISAIEQSNSKPYLVLEEAWVSYSQNSWELKAGSQLFDWSVFDVFKVSDVINRIHLATWVSDSVEDPDKYGEPSISFEKKFGTTRLDMSINPFLFDTPFPDSSNRMNILHSSFNSNTFINSDERYLYSGDMFFQWSIKNSYIINSSEVSLYALRQYDRRHPLFNIQNNGSITPIYFPMYQYGVTYRQLWNAFQFKLEAAYRNYDNLNVQIFDGETLSTKSQVNHFPVALGTEYTQSYVNGSESIVLLEFQQIYGTTYEERVNLDVFQKDLFLGYTYLFNNIHDTKIEASILLDLEGRDEWMERLVFSSRVTDQVRFRIGGILFQADSKGSIPRGLEVLRDNSQVFVEFKYYL